MIIVLFTNLGCLFKTEMFDLMVAKNKKRFNMNED